jgi:delta8-fatty-acid desaturase
MPHFLAGTLHEDALKYAASPPLIIDPALYPSQEALDASPLKPIMDHPELAPSGNAIKTMDHPKNVPLDSPSFLQHTALIIEKYRALDKHLRDSGMYTTRLSFYWLNLAKFIVMYSSVFYLVLWRIVPSIELHSSTAMESTLSFTYWSTVVLASVLLGMFWHQVAFVAHDAGHISITGNYALDWNIGWMLGNCFGGVSIGWWKSSHNTHHIITNHPEHDPDIQHLPVFAITPLFFQNLYSSFHKRFLFFDAASRFLVQFQHLLYYPIMMLARFNLYLQSVIFLVTDKDTNKRCYQEGLGLGCFWLWFGWLMSRMSASLATQLVFLFVSHAVTFLLHLQITLSHFAMSVHEISPNESFPARMIRTTMDVDCPTWLDWFHGGLQFQTIHHLFPRLPRTSFRQALPLVKKFSEDTGLEYIMVPFVKGNQMIIGNLREVSRQLRIILRKEDLKLK